VHLTRPVQPPQLTPWQGNVKVSLAIAAPHAARIDMVAMTVPDSARRT
jgi:hypothetical protein